MAITKANLDAALADETPETEETPTNPSADDEQQDGQDLDEDDQQHPETEDDSDDDEDNEDKEDPLAKAKAEAEFHKKRHKESTREALIWKQRADRLSAADQKPLTEDDMKKVDPDWDSLSDSEKRLALRASEAERTAKLATNAVLDFVQEQKNREEVDDFIATNPDIQAKADEFKKFIRMPTHKGVPIDILASAFRYELPKAQQPRQRGSALEPASGGVKGDLKKKEGMSEDELSILRVKDPRAYRKALIEGKI